MLFSLKFFCICIFTMTTIFNVHATAQRLFQLHDQILTDWRREINLRRCVENQAAQNNLTDALVLIQKIFPEYKIPLTQKAQSLGEKLSTGCLSAEKVSYEIHPYRQHNPNLDRFWPNWFIRFAKVNRKDSNL